MNKYTYSPISLWNIKKKLHMKLHFKYICLKKKFLIDQMINQIRP